MIAARISLLCGVALALTAATVGTAFFGVTTWLTLVPLVGGVALAGIGAVAVTLGRRARSSTSSLVRTPVDGGAGVSAATAQARIVVEVVVAVGLAVAVNAASLYAPAFVDVTRSRRNTLAEGSVAVARDIKSDVVVRTTLSADDRAYAELAELVDRYARAGAHVSLARVSTAKDPEAARAFGDERVIVVGPDGIRQRVRFIAGAPDHEALLTNALRGVTAGKRPRVYAVAGHGEAQLDDDGPAGLRRFGEALVDEGLEVVPLPLAAVGLVPDDAAAVVVAGAQALPAADSAALQRYLDGGGRVLALLEPGAESLAGLLGSVGVQANDDVAIDNSTFAGLLGPETATGVAYATHPVTAKLGGAMTHFPRARSLTENPGTPATVTALVQTGADAFGETHPASAPALDDADNKGPLTLAYAATAAKSRVVVVGDATFATNQGIALGANRDFAVNAVLWLVDKEGAIAVRARGRGGNLLLLTPTARERVAFALLYGLPVALLCAGLSIGAIRRRR